MISNPNITLHAVGFSIREDDLVQKAGCCVTMEFEDEYGRKSKRVITHPIGSASLERAHLQAAHLALASVVRRMRRISNVKFYCPLCVQEVLDETNPKFSEVKVDNVDVIGETKRWVTFYTSLSFVACVAHNMLGVDQAKECAEFQFGSDTGTVII